LAEQYTIPASTLIIWRNEGMQSYRRNSREHEDTNELMATGKGVN
jgi:hypothetical protein